MAGPLEGVRVVDLTIAVAGPFCTMFLADLGAEVIKIEDPAGGDMTRQSGPHAPDDDLRAYGAFFQSVNRNKKSVAVDLKTPEGKEVLRRLMRNSQVLVENFRAGVMERLGLGYESLSQINPSLVYAAIRGFGDPRTGQSPYTYRPAFDIVAQAMGGLMSVTGPGPEMPLKAAGGIGDTVPALMTGIGILAALRHAEQTGEGQFLDVAMYDGVLCINDRVIYMYTYAGIVMQPQGNRHSLFCPFEVFPARDGWVAICAPNDNHWQALCRAMGVPELADDPRFLHNEDRVRHCELVRTMVSEWTSRHTKAEIVRILGDDVPCGPVNNALDILQDPHVRARNMLVEVEHPGCKSPKVLSGQPIKLTRTPARVGSRAPLLGEHTREVLLSLGYGHEEIDSLQQRGVVACWQNG